MLRFLRNPWIVLLLLALVVSAIVSLVLRVTNKQAVLASPILGISNLKIADNLWFPKRSFLAGGFKQGLSITAKAAFFVETQSGEVLFEKSPKERLPIASLVKIMTAIVALESRQMEDILKVSERAAGMEPDKMFLRAGERLSIEELLEGMFLVSANDAAEVLAEEAMGRREEFINLMNSKAIMLDMKDTRFINPSGLEEDEEKQYSTAFDVALMARYATRQWPDLVKISSQPHIYIPRTDNHQDYDLYSGINLLTTYEGVVGFKTGFTPEAGLTLVTLARREGKEVLGVLLGSTNRRDDAKLLLDYSFARLGI